MSKFIESLGKTAISMQESHQRYQTAKGVYGGIMLGGAAFIFGLIILISGIISGELTNILIGVAVIVVGGGLGYFIYYSSKKTLQMLNQGSSNRLYTNQPVKME